MTTLRELAEMIIESEDTGRKIQRHYIPSIENTWSICSENTFDLRRYEYRLEPKIVKHERWALTAHPEYEGFSTKKHAMEAVERNPSLKRMYIVQHTWETDE